MTGSDEDASTSSSRTSATVRETSTASRSSDSQRPGSASATSTAVTVSSSPDTAGTSTTGSTTKRAEDSSGYDLSTTAESASSVTVTLLSSVSLTVTKVSSSAESGLTLPTASSSDGTVLSSGGVVPVTTASYTLTTTVLTSPANSTSPGSSSSGYNATARTLTSSTVETATRTLVETVVSSGAASGSTSLGGALTSAAGSWNTSTGMQAPNDTVTTTVVSATTISVSSVSGAPTILSPTQGGPPGSWNSTAGPIGTGASNGTPIIPVPTGGWNSTKLTGVPAPPNTAPPGSGSTPSGAGATTISRPANVTVSELPGPILTPPAPVSPSVINGTVVPTVIGGPTFPGWNSSMATSIRPSGSAFSTGSGASIQTSVTAAPSFPNTTAGVPPSANSSTTVATPPPPFSATTLETFTPFPTASFTGSITGSVTTMVAGLNTSSPINVPSPTGVPSGNCTLGQACSVIAPSPTAPLGSVIPAANLTGVTRTAFTSQEKCYTLSRDQSSEDLSRRALLRNSKLREDNVTIPVPYIESIDFSDQGLDPFFVTVRDSSQGTFYLDVSNGSRVALVDQGGNSLVLDPQGVHLATNSCMLGISIEIDDLYRQLADFSNVSCSTSSLLPRRRASAEKKRAEDLRFDQTLYLRDQCGGPVTRAIRDFPALAVGNSSCTNMATDPRSGRWDFDCAFPGAASGAMQCQRAIRQDVVDFLTRDSFGDACPSLPTVISTLARSAQDIFDAEALRTSFSDAGDGSEAEAEQLDIETTIASYQRLWATLQELFALSTDSGVGGGPATSPLERYISVYDENRSFAEDICEDLHAGEMPLNLSLPAGATRIDAITSLNWAPGNDEATPYNITVQDPSAVACCAGGAVADDDGDSCAYPRDAVVAGTDCICGRLAGGGSLAFEGTECDRYDGVCAGDGDCRGGLVCVVGTCCGAGVCVDPYACSQNGTALVKVGIIPSW